MAGVATVTRTTTGATANDLASARIAVCMRRWKRIVLGEFNGWGIQTWIF
jgi:hypothetical protein